MPMVDVVGQSGGKGVYNNVIKGLYVAAGAIGATGILLGLVAAGRYVKDLVTKDSAIFDKRLIPTYVEVQSGKDMDDNSFKANKSYAWVMAIIDENSNGKADPGEPAVHFGVTEDRVTEDALKQVAQNIKNSETIVVSKPTKIDYKMSSYRPPGVSEIGDRMIVDEDLVTGYSTVKLSPQVIRRVNRTRPAPTGRRPAVR